MNDIWDLLRFKFQYKEQIPCCILLYLSLFVIGLSVYEIWGSAA